MEEKSNSKTTVVADFSRRSNDCLD